ncbi:hypothetical protein PGT21_015988 [Puccinia graminis f. sp. tritici]|uniref:Uncharacterized protein n=1 Tax=Puccinia graminis f. sp. tritici TaxID=56615 RepID=A0A5B0N2N9_PUCGR|nr:hypothetical protein PGT21_015988 [Puccinia graminis f. sp. tritici]
MAEFKKFMKTGPKPATNAGKSFASVASTTLANYAPPDQTSPRLLEAKTGHHPLEPSKYHTEGCAQRALVQKANEALLGLDARVDGEAIAIRGASMLPSGNVSF